MVGMRKGLVVKDVGVRDIREFINDEKAWRVCTNE